MLLTAELVAARCLDGGGDVGFLSVQDIDLQGVEPMFNYLVTACSPTLTLLETLMGIYIHHVHLSLSMLSRPDKWWTKISLSDHRLLSLRE